MKVILNKDLSTLGEEGDVKDVAKGYARNYLFPRGIAFPYNERTVKLFESRKGDIEARKAEKREAAKGLKERIEALDLLVTMPAGANGRLFGSVTSQTVADELVRRGFQIERKRIELPGTSFKSVGKYRLMVHLYENAVAELGITVQAQVVQKAPESSSAARGRRRRSGETETQAQGPAEGAVEHPAGTGVENPAADTAPPLEDGGAVSTGTVSAETASTETAPTETAPTETAPTGAASAQTGTTASGETGSPQA
jgi:large subunit ribosomal protein L9